MPVIFGAVLIFVGVLIIRFPILLPYFVAAMFIVAGAGLMMAGLGLKSRVSYHRLDSAFRGVDQGEEA